MEDGGRGAISSMQNAGQAAARTGSGELSASSPEGHGCVSSPSPTLTDATQPTCYALATLLHFPVQLFCLVGFFLSAQKLQGMHLRIFLGRGVCVCVCGVMFTWRLSASFHCG